LVIFLLYSFKHSSATFPSKIWSRFSSATTISMKIWTVLTHTAIFS
jgi:hypothetical protein